MSQAHVITRLDQERNEASAQRELLLRAFDQAPGFVATLESPEHRFTFANSAYRTLIGGREVMGKTAREAPPSAPLLPGCSGDGEAGPA